MTAPRTPRRRYPARHEGPTPTGLADKQGNIHDDQGRFAGRVQSEADPGMIGTDGSFYWPPRMTEATADEIIEYWSTVVLPDDALNTLWNGYAEARDQDEAPDIPDRLGSASLRSLLRAMRMWRTATKSLPAGERDKVLNHTVDVAYPPGADTVSNAIARYRITPELAETVMSHPDRFDQLEDLVRSMANTLSKVNKRVKEIEETVEEIEGTAIETRRDADLIARTVNRHVAREREVR